MVVGHAAAQVALGEDRHEREHAAGQERMPVGVAVLLDAPEPPARDDEDDHRDAIPSQKCTVPMRNALPRSSVCAWPQTSRPVAPASTVPATAPPTTQGSAAHERVAAEVGAPAQQHDHVERDGDDRQVRGGAMELGEMRHAAAS